MLLAQQLYNAFNVYCRELAPGTVNLTSDRAQGDDSKHWAYSRTTISIATDNNIKNKYNEEAVHRIY